MVLNMADVGKSWKSRQTLWNASKTDLKWFMIAFVTVCVDLGWILKGRKLAYFEQKAWAIAHGFWPMLASPGNRGKLSETDLKWFIAFVTVCVDLGWILKGRKLADFEQKAWAIAHGFEHGRFWQVLEIAPNSLKRLQNRSKMICDCFRDYLCRFRVNS